MHQQHGQNHFIEHIHNDKLLCIMQLFSQYNIHPYLTETFYMTSLILCANPICQQEGFILYKQQWRGVQHHELLTHNMHTVINANILSCITHQLNTKQYHEMTIEYLYFICFVGRLLLDHSGSSSSSFMKLSFLIQMIRWIRGSSRIEFFIFLIA